jgi:predicted transcriptional regulator
MTSLCVRLDEVVHVRLANLSERTGKSRAWYVKQALWEALPRLEWENRLQMEHVEALHGFLDMKSSTELYRAIGDGNVGELS